MEAVWIAAAALGLSAVSFFYRVGRDTREEEEGGSKLDRIYARLESVDRKIDRLGEWQLESAGIHERHKEQLKTLFSRVEALERERKLPAQGQAARSS